MTSRVFIPLLTIVAFGAGYGARIWNEHFRCPVPPSGAGAAHGTFDDTRASEGQREVHHAQRPPNAAKLAAEIERLRPSIEEFLKEIEKMDG